MQPVTGSSTLSKTSGGTSHYLPAERKKASFDSAKLTEFLQGGSAKYQQDTAWKKVFDPHTNPLFDFTYDHHDDRKTAFKKSLARTMAAHKIVKKNPDLMATHMTGGFGVSPNVQSGPAAIGNHYGIFLGSILTHASDEQKAEWFQKVINLKILGAYAQTELGHGSNVRGLETTATFDEKTDEWVIDSPYLTSAKWWPGCFGLLATHSVVYARLILKGKDYGIHSFMVQLRDENHKALEGIEVGDIGPKFGYNLIDSGYCLFHNVRIPRTNLLAKYQHVTKDGQYVKTKKKTEAKESKADNKQLEAASNRLQYITMIATRVGMVYGAYSGLAKAVTIAVRYSAVRHQGFKDTRGDGHKSGEFAVLDYQVQQYRLFKALSQAYAFFFVAYQIRAKMIAFTKDLAAGDVSELPELHATSAGLKAFTTNWAGDSMEECRRCCGGHGVTLSGGIAKHLVDFNSVTPIAEGDKIVLALQTARFLVRSVEAIRKKQPVSGVVKYLEGEERKPDFSQLRDLNTLLDTFRWRARQSVFYATEQFQNTLKKGEAFDEAWNKNAVELVQAAEHHCSYVLALTFATELNKFKDENIKRVLHTLALHFILVQIKERAGDWAPHISATQIQEVKRTVNQLLAEIRPDAVALVDSFGFSDNSLQSAIGRYDGNVYEALYDYAKKSPLNERSYIESFWNEHLKDVLDLDYLKKNKSTQRVSKL